MKGGVPMTVPKSITSFLTKTKHILRNIGAAIGGFCRRVFNPHPMTKLKKVGYYCGYFASLALKLAGTAVLILICTLAVVVAYAAIFVAKGMDPAPAVTLEEFDPKLSTLFYAKDPDTGGWVVVDTISGEENRQWALYDEIPEYMKKAVVAIEDKRFWDHEGVDWKRTVGAFANMFLTMRNNFGGSTITQQLIKNVTGNDEVTVKRKFQEIFQALEFEQRYKKETILEFYLNYIYLGEG